MSDIASLIAGSGQTNADFDLGKINKSYWEGQDQRAKSDLRDAFKGGVPTNADGSIDYATMQRTLYQKGGLEQGNALSGISARSSELAALNSADSPAPPAQPIVGPSTSRNSVTIDPSKRADASTPPAPQQPAQQPTVMTVLAAQGIPNDQLQAASASLARQLGVDPAAPLNLQDPQVRNVLAPAVAQIKRMGLGQVQPPQPGDNAPAQTAQAAPLDDPVLKRLTLLTASQDKQISAAAKVRLEAYLKNKEATTEMKNAAASGMGLPAYQERQGELASQQAGSTERAKADVKEQQTYIDAGKAASQRLGTLNTLSNIISSDKNLTLGFGAETALKAKMALQQLGINVGDLSGAEAIQKLNASLASEMTKALASRPTQFEFKTFLANNPGLLLDKAGNERLIGMFSQLAKREADIGKLARKNQDNWSNWDGVVENYDKSHPIIDPVTKKVLSTDSIIAPGPGKPASTAGTAQAATMISSKADYDKLQSGATFTGPDGKPWRKP